MTETNREFGPVEQFKQDLPSRYEDMAEDVSKTAESVVMKLENGKTISPDITVPLLARGWVVTSHAGVDQNRFFFKRLETEEREVERVVTETVGTAVDVE